jgi:hypothetical protein
MASYLKVQIDSMLWLKVCVNISNSTEHEDILSKETLHALFLVSPTTQVILHIGKQFFLHKNSLDQ